jgi:hypothetical protein
MNKKDEKTDDDFTYSQKNNLKCIWLIWASVITIVLIAVYFFLHLNLKEEGHELVSLNKEQLTMINSFIAQKSDTTKTTELIVNYLEKILPEHEDNIEGLVNMYTHEQLITVLPNYPFKIKSFFWLTGSKILLEVAF